ncbi:ATP-binding cassette domain-containing protein [Parafrigoribacterium soli]|uniref:ATP-binding cassette domain-containing protein n=1 Tax=Parafrigoribacterium soli TaxID=3144663 RepID=UPI0032F03A1D
MTPARSDVAVSARDLSVRYRSNGVSSLFVAVRGVSLEINQGEFLWLVGESGAGKSTLGRAFVGLVRRGAIEEGVPEICGGSLTVLGTSMRRVGRRRRDRVTIGIGYLAQDAAERLSPELSVAENVAEPIYSRDRHFSNREATEAVAAVVDAVRLPLSLMHRMPYELSSGQRQRVALARSLVLEPRLLVADEPARGVDATLRSSVLESLAELREQRGMAALIVSSSLADLNGNATRLAVMQHGVIVGLGTPDEVLEGPHHPYLKSLAAQRPTTTDEEEERDD